MVDIVRSNLILHLLKTTDRERAQQIVDRLQRLYDTMIHCSDPTLKAMVDLYVYNPDNFTSFEDFLMQVVEAQSKSHSITREAFAKHLADNPLVMHMPVQKWQDMNS